MRGNKQTLKTWYELLRVDQNASLDKVEEAYTNFIKYRLIDSNDEEYEIISKAVEKLRCENDKADSSSMSVGGSNFIKIRMSKEELSKKKIKTNNSKELINAALLSSAFVFALIFIIIIAY